MTRWPLAVATGLVVSLGSEASAQSSDPTVEALQQELKALRTLVEDQAKRIEALEAAAPDNVERIDAPQAALLPAEASDNSDIGSFPDDAIVTTGDFPGSIKIPGRGGSVKIGGFVRADIVHDTDSLGFEDLVINRTIPLDGASGDGDSQTRLNARLSRINFDYRRPTRLGQFRTFIEADFFGGGDELRSNYEFRLRHAAAQLGNFYVGQWWSSFTDVGALPEASDFAGPLGKVAVRQPGIRWADDIGAGWRLGLAIENPAGDLSGPELALSSESVPDLIGYAQLTRDWGRVKVAALGRQLETASSSEWAGGISVSGRIPVPLLDDRDNIAFQGLAGNGMTRYLAGFAGSGLDGSVGADGNIDPSGLLGGYLAYQHWWTDKWRSTVSASALTLDLGDGALLQAFESGEYFSANLFWTPVDGATFGFDAIYATQETLSGLDGDGFRLQGSARFDF